MANRTDAIMQFLLTDTWTVPDVPEELRWQAIYEHVAGHFPDLTKREFAAAFKLTVEQHRADLVASRTTRQH